MARPRKDQQIDIPACAVDATIQLLDERDAAAITLAEVAAVVGCRAPALYAYFANKDALLRAARNARNPLERLRAGGLAYLRFALERPGLYRLMFSPPGAQGLPANPFASDPGAQCLALLHSAIVACQAQGYLPEKDPTQMAFVLWSAVHGAASLVLQGRAPVQTGQDPLAAATGAVEALMSFVQQSRLSNRGSH
jgi:AcrR family transcriptional regulator